MLGFWNDIFYDPNNKSDVKHRAIRKIMKSRNEKRKIILERFANYVWMLQTNKGVEGNQKIDHCIIASAITKYAKCNNLTFDEAYHASEVLLNIDVMMVR